MNAKAKGETTEAIILAHLMKLGYAVSIPFGNNQRYDLILDDGKALFRVQCKTGRFINGCVAFMTCSKNGFTNKRTPYYNQIEFFLVYSPNTEKIYKVPVNKTSKTQMMLRVNENQGGNYTRINWAKDFII
jgi:hypothetical protein